MSSLCLCCSQRSVFEDVVQQVDDLDEEHLKNITITQATI